MLAVGDGALGFWGAIREVFSETRGQRCWVHKVAIDVLSALPKSAQPRAKRMLGEIRDARTAPEPNGPPGRSPTPTAPNTPRRSRRSPMTSSHCSRSSTFPPSTGSTSRPRTRSNPPSRPSGCAAGSLRALAHAPPASRWPTSSSKPPRTDGEPSTRPTSSPLSEPAPASTSGVIIERDPAEEATAA